MSDTPSSNIVPREWNGVVIPQRRDDRYINATAMCKSNGKQWNDYWRNKASQEFLEELSSVTGIPVTELVQVRQGVPVGGTPADQGTWVHPQVAIHLAQWCSPAFAVRVSQWMEELLTRGVVTSRPMSKLEVLAQQVQAMIEIERRQAEIEEQTSTALTAAVEAKRVATAALDTATSNYGYYTVLAYLRLRGIDADRSMACQVGKLASKLARNFGHSIGGVKDVRFGTVNTYPEAVLKTAVDTLFDTTEDQ